MDRLKAFFALCRAGLWADVVEGTQLDPAPFAAATEEEWVALYRMALSQAMVAICFDGLRQLPVTCRPPRPLYLQWAAKTAQVEQTNKVLNVMARRVIALCRAEGIHPVVLKGQGVAACYAHPLHRQCGDIDLFVGRADAKRTVRLLEAAGAEQDGEANYKHVGLDWEGIHLEIHRLVGRLNNPWTNRQLQHWVGEWYPEAIGHRQGFPVPDATFEAYFIFHHAFGHFLNSGIGLRQLCDWARLLYTQHQQRAGAECAGVPHDGLHPDGGELEACFSHLGLLRAAQIFGDVLVRQLGLPFACLPWASADEQGLGDLLLREILATGNFGQWDSRIPPRPKGYWSGKWHTFTRVLRRCRMLYRFAPAEAFWYPLRLVQGTLAIQYDRLIHRQQF